MVLLLILFIIFGIILFSMGLFLDCLDKLPYEQRVINKSKFSEWFRWGPVYVKNERESKTLSPIITKQTVKPRIN